MIERSGTGNRSDRRPWDVRPEASPLRYGWRETSLEALDGCPVEAIVREVEG
jgi:hypothetical protein